MSYKNPLFRKNIFNEINGYQEIEFLNSGDDDLLMHKISKYHKCNITFLLTHNAMVLSKPPKNIRDFIIQRLRFSSKGLWYYKWKAHISLRASLPLLYITNITAACSIILFTSTASLYTLFPLFIKSFGDAIITYKYH